MTPVQISAVNLSGAVWFCIGYRDLFEPRQKEGGEIFCPVCGAEEAGIAKHIRAVHGKDAFRSETVKL